MPTDSIHRARRWHGRASHRQSVRTNNPLPTTGATVAWSPDSKRVAYVSSVPGPETADAEGDPVVITRYLYKPDADEGMTRFNDNRRLHIFVWDSATGASKQMTSGDHYEHSIDWSPNGQEIVFTSNREPNEDQFFNSDIRCCASRRANASDHRHHRKRRVSQPRWSPDGKTLRSIKARSRGLTDLETTMEDTHIWSIDADGKNAGERFGYNRSTSARRAGVVGGWKEYIWFTSARRRQYTVWLRHAGGRAAKLGFSQIMVGGQGAVTGFSLGRDGSVAYTFCG